MIAVAGTLERPPSMTVDLDLSDVQLGPWYSKKPYIGVCTGIRGGKTRFGRNFVARRVVECPRSEILATANSYSQLGLVTIPNLTDAFEEWHLPYQYKKADRMFLVYTRRGVCRVHLRSTDNFDLARGAEFGTIWMDEVRDAKPGAIAMLKGRMSCPWVEMPRMLATTTPNGYDGFYTEFAEGDTRYHDFFRWRTRDNPHLRSDYVEQLYEGYDPQLARQELDAEFVVMGAGKVYHQFDRTVHVRGDIAYRPDLPIYLCVDFNIGTMGWVLVQEQRKGELVVIDEMFLRDCTIRRAVECVHEKYGKHKSGWIVTGDATDGRSRHTGETDWHELREAVRHFGFIDLVTRVPSSNPRKKDRTNAVNRMLRSAAGVISLWLSDRCKELRADLEQLTWKNGDIDKKRDPDRSHVSDALGYLIADRFPAGGQTIFTQEA